MSTNEIENIIGGYRPNERPDETYASTITSADVKLAYNHDEDRFEAFIIGDINANPEGLKMQTQWQGELYDGKELDEVIADGYLHNAHKNAENGDISVAMNMHPATYADGDWTASPGDNWLVDDKRLVADAVDRIVETLYPAEPGTITYQDGELHVNDTSVDGYVNVYDRGEELGEGLENDVQAHAKGANAPPAVWNTTDALRPWTDKVGLLDTAEEVAQYLDGVHTADHEKVYTLSDALQFKEDDAPVVIKGAIGTWGDSVVALEDNEYENALSTVRSEENRVRSVGNRPGDFRILDEDGHFVVSSVGDKNANNDTFDTQTYGLVEEAITGTIERDGNTYTVFDFEDQPVDFVPLATYDPETQDAEVYGITVRSSGTNNLNANRGGKNFSVQSLQQAFEQGVHDGKEYGTIAYNLQDELEALAGRDVTYEEAVTPLKNAGKAALATRNIAAFKAEEQLEGRS